VLGGTIRPSGGDLYSRSRTLINLLIDLAYAFSTEIRC
jgi:hypothetical protein